MAACLGRDSEGNPVRKAGVMSVVIKGGQVAAGDAILVELPAGPQEALKPV
jgi:MOSC domain-containing protein YiiM